MEDIKKMRKKPKGKVRERSQYEIMGIEHIKRSSQRTHGEDSKDR